MGFLGDLFGGGDRTTSSRSSYGLAPYDPGISQGFAEQLGWSPASMQTTRPAAPSFTFGNPLRGDSGSITPGPLVRRRTSRPEEREGYENRRFGNEWYTRRVGASNMPARLSDFIRTQSNTARQRYGGQLARSAGGTNPAIQRRLAAMEQQQILQQAAMEDERTRAILAQMAGLTSRPVQTSGSQTQEGQGFAGGLGGMLGSLGGAALTGYLSRPRF